MKLVDGYSRPKFHIAGAMEWLCFRLDMLSSLTFAFSLVLLISIPKGVIEPGTWLTTYYSLLLLRVNNERELKVVVFLPSSNCGFGCHIWTQPKYVTSLGNMEPLQFREQDYIG